MFFQLIKRLFGLIGEYTLLAFLLLIIALASTVWTLSDVVRALDQGLLLVMAFGGLLLGWLLAKAKPVPGRLAAILITILGFEIVILRVGNLGQPILVTGQYLVDWAWQVQPWFPAETTDSSLVATHIGALWAGVETLLTRLWTWSVAWAAGEPAFDPIVTTLIWSLVLWGVAAWAGWYVRRRQKPLLAIAPIGALLATVLAYTPGQLESLLLVLGVTLLLMGLVRNYAREQRWKRHNIDFAVDIQVDLAVVIVPIALCLVMVAWLIPSISIRSISRYTQQFFWGQVEQVEPALGLKRSVDDQPDLLKSVRSPGLPRRHLLGSGPELSEQVAMIINTGQSPVEPAQIDTAPPAPRYYWRSITYDTYSGRGWQTAKTQPISYAAGEAAIAADLPGRRMLRQSVQLVENQSGLLYAAGDVAAADHDYSINWRAPGDPFAATIETAAYRVDSLVATVGADELRATGSTYPDWLQEHYLKLPKQVPQRVLTLARDLTATAPTPYDRAKAIEAHLRTYPYNLDLPEPPLTGDIVDYFLFDLQQGYCDYYATSMVVLARAAGLPARMAIGYASGTYDPLKAHYVVTEADAHSWPEIYFSEYGWIKFEPTAAQPVNDRTSAPSLPEFAQSLPPLDPAPIQPAGGGFSWWLLLPGGLALLVVGGLGWLWVDTWRLRRLAPVAAVATIYRRLYRYGRRLDVPVWSGDTPYEFSTALAGRIKAIDQDKRWSNFIAPAAREVDQLTNLYVQSAYSNHPLDSADQRQTIKTWQHLRRRLWVAWVSVFTARVGRSYD